MSEIEREIMIAQDAELLQWTGEIMRDQSLYENAEFDWFAWCCNRRLDLNQRAIKTGNFPAMEEARKASRLGAMTVHEVFIPAQSEQLDPADERISVEQFTAQLNGIDQAA